MIYSCSSEKKIAIKCKVSVCLNTHINTHMHSHTYIDINKCTCTDTYKYECTDIYTCTTHTSTQEHTHCLTLWRLTTFYSVRRSEKKTTMTFDFSSKIILV